MVTRRSLIGAVGFGTRAVLSGLVDAGPAGVPTGPTAPLNEAVLPPRAIADGRSHPPRCAFAAPDAAERSAHPIACRSAARAAPMTAPSSPPRSTPPRRSPTRARLRCSARLIIAAPSASASMPIGTPPASRRWSRSGRACGGVAARVCYAGDDTVSQRQRELHLRIPANRDEAARSSAGVRGIAGRRNGGDNRAHRQELPSRGSGAHAVYRATNLILSDVALADLLIWPPVRDSSTLRHEHCARLGGRLHQGSFQHFSACSEITPNSDGQGRRKVPES
jgi:hypothetical protein